MDSLKNMNEIKKAQEIFEKYDIKTRLNGDGLIIISHYCQPKEKTFKELDINEDELIKNVVACEGKFDLRKSSLTTFPLVVANEIVMYEDTRITEMPNLKVVGCLVANSKLKKLPKLKTLGVATFENSVVKALPKLKEAKTLVIQNSKIKDLSSLVDVEKLCIIDSDVEDLKNLKNAKDIFICSSDLEHLSQVSILAKLENVENLFVANSTLKSMPNLKHATKIALYNCQIKSVKSSITKDVEIKKSINDEELSEKFDTFTNWYNSNVLNSSIDLIGDIVNLIQG